MARSSLISTTAYQNGSSYRFRTVGGLTKGEKEAAKSGGIVLFKGVSWSRKNQQGTLYRQVYFKDGQFMAKVPDNEILKLIGETNGCN